MLNILNYSELQLLRQVLSLKPQLIYLVVLASQRLPEEFLLSVFPELQLQTPTTVLALHTGVGDVS